MTKQPDSDKFSADETEQRVKKALEGAFKGAALPLKGAPRKPRSRRRKTASPKARKIA